MPSYQDIANKAYLACNKYLQSFNKTIYRGFCLTASELFHPEEGKWQNRRHWGSARSTYNDLFINEENKTDKIRLSK